MKLDYCMISSDSNPYYLDFWPICSKLWKTRIGVTPILCYIGEDHAIDLSEKYGKVIKIKPVKGIPAYFQAAWSRFFVATKYVNSIVIISDIDMLPLSKFYFSTQIESVNDNLYVHLNPCIETYGHLPACYHIAKGYLFKEIFKIPDDWNESCQYLFNLNLGKDANLLHLNESNHWFAEEIYTTLKIFEYSDQSLFKFIPRLGGQNGRRIDRGNWFYDFELLKQNYYFDAHCLRPYAKYKNLIDPLLKYKPLPRIRYFTQYQLPTLYHRAMSKLGHNSTA